MFNIMGGVCLCGCVGTAIMEMPVFWYHRAHSSFITVGANEMVRSPCLLDGTCGFRSMYQTLNGLITNFSRSGVPIS